MNRRIPPHNLDAERMVLASMLAYREAVDATASTLVPGMFYDPNHAHICEAIQDLYRFGRPVDSVTVAEELDRKGLREQVGPTLTEAAGTLSGWSTAEHYAGMVAGKAKLRALAAVAAEIDQIAYSNPADAGDALEQAESLLFDLNDNVDGDRGEGEWLADLLGKNLDEMERLHENGGEIGGVSTGFADLDDKLNGLQPGRLYVIAARPSMGKSALAGQIAVNAAADCGRPSICFSLEMEKTELSQRMLNVEALVDGSKVRKGDIDETAWARISHAVGSLSERRVKIFDPSGATLMDIRSKVRREASREPLGVIVVDYIQLMEAETSADSRQIEVSKISRGLKILAREMNCPVIALAQVNRACVSRPDKRPLLADLRESGSIEQDCDVAAFIYRDELYDENSMDRGIAEVIVRKQRGGPTGTVRLAFRGQYTRFDNLAPAAQPAPSRKLAAVPSMGADGATPTEF